MRFPHEICADIDKLGVDAEKALNANMFRIADWYTCITGRLPPQVPEDMASSLRVADLGVISAKYWNLGRGEDPQANPEYVEFALFDNLARLFSYNDENSCIKFLNTTLARLKQDRRATMCGFTTGVLERKTYSDLKSMCDGIVDLKTTEADATSHTIIRVRSFPDAMYSKGWYTVKPQNGMVTLVPAPEISEKYRTPSSNRKQ